MNTTGTGVQRIELDLGTRVEISFGGRTIFVEALDTIGGTKPVMGATIESAAEITSSDPDVDGHRINTGDDWNGSTFVTIWATT